MSGTVVAIQTHETASVTSQRFFFSRLAGSVGPLADDAAPARLPQGGHTLLPSGMVAVIGPVFAGYRDGLLSSPKGIPATILQNSGRPYSHPLSMA